MVLGNSVDDSEHLPEAIRLIRNNDIEGLASLYMDGFDVKKHQESLICSANEAGYDHMVTWIKAVSSARY